MPAGIEDIEFGPDGRLWALSEAGSKRWNTWPTFFPVVFSLEHEFPALAGRRGGPSSRSRRRRGHPLRWLLIALASFRCCCAKPQPADFSIPPTGPSPFAGRVQQRRAGLHADAGWGVTAGILGGFSRAVYVTDLLVDPAHAFVLQLPVPNDSNLFGSYAGSTRPYANLICYPTDAGKPGAPNYVLPTGNVVPHMQRGAEPPIFPACKQPISPCCCFSSGLSGSPISGDYVESVEIPGELRLRRRRALPWRSAPSPDVKLDGFKDTIYAFSPPEGFCRDAGGAAAVVVRGARCGAQSSGFSRITSMRRT